MCDGRRFQADGAATEKELLEGWRLNRGTMTVCLYFKQLLFASVRLTTLADNNDDNNDDDDDDDDDCLSGW